MGQRILDIRVRPARVAILINREAVIGDLLLAFEFCSRIWGGRFAQILPVEGASCDPLTEYRLSRFRPDYVYGIGLDHDSWGRAAVAACQPRGYGQLQPDFVRGLHESHAEQYILVDHAVRDLLRKRDSRPYRRRRLSVVSAEESPWAAHGAAMFGVHYKDLKREHFDESHSLTASSPRHAFMELVKLFASDALQSWLDVTGHKLNVGVSWGEELAARIVLVRSTVEDLSLFWNLRSTTDSDRPAPIIPLAAEEAADDAALSCLKDWILSLAEYGVHSNYCLVTSQTVGEGDCRRFAAKLMQWLEGTPTRYVDYQPPRKRLPVVVPYDSSALWPVQLTGRRLSFLPPGVKAFDALGPSRTWFVDLMKDTQIRRRVACPGCGSRIALGSRVDMGYSLHRAVRTAIREGIIPVVLTGRFLERMTSRGFFWLPGVKYREGAVSGDIDVLACCDGLLVFCECKDLSDAMPDKINWDEIVVQFIQTADLAHRCNGDLAVLASLVDAYPDSLRSAIASALKDRIPYLLLDRHDLDRGERRVEEHNWSRGLRFHDLIAEPFPHDPIKRFSDPTQQRQIQFGLAGMRS